jgi:hypothetical protein
MPKQESYTPSRIEDHPFGRRQRPLLSSILFIGSLIAERKTDLDSGCSLQAESGGKSTGVVEQEKNNAWTNAASRSDAEHDIDSIERSV